MNTPSYAATPNIGSALINTANTNTDGTGGGSFPTVLTAGADGTKVNFVQIKGIVAAGATQAADTVRLWLYDGANKRLFREVQVAAGGGVISATVLNFETTIAIGIDLETGWSLLASTHVGGATASYHVTAGGADY